MKKFLLIIATVFLAFAYTFSQGTVRGKVNDDNGESVIGASVYLKSNRSIGTITNINGDFSLKITEATDQVLVVSYVGLNTIEEPIRIAGGEIVIKNFILSSQTQALTEVTITAKAIRAKESYMEKMKAKSAVSIDYISSETIKKIGDSNVSSALGRVSGVSTFGGFFTVRGIGDRYVKTTINGARIPTLDPFTNNIKLDLFPSALIDNIVLTKTASPDLPGDWAGAYLSIETKDYPEKLSINAETSFGYNSQTTFKEIISSQHSATDWLGFDNGLRDIDVPPVGNPNLSQGDVSQSKMYLGILGDYFSSLGITSETPWTEAYTKLALIQLGFLGSAQKDDVDAYNAALTRFNSNEGGYKQQGLEAGYKEYIDVARKLPNNWMPIKRKAPLDFSQSFSIGNQTTLFGKPLGYIMGVRYSKAVLSDPEVEYGRFNGGDEIMNTTDKSILLRDQKYRYLGFLNNTIETNNWSGLINLAYNFNPNHSVSVMFMPNVIGVNRVNQSSMNFYNDSGDQFDNTPTQSYESRKQLVYQIKSEHYFKGTGLKVDCNLSITNGASNAPDNKRFDLQKYSEVSYGLFNSPRAFRSFRYLTENILDARINAELPLGKKTGKVSKLKFGGAYLDMYRFGENIAYTLDWSVIRNFSDPIAEMDISNFEATSAIPIYGYSGVMGAANNIIGFNKIKAAYVMVDYELFAHLRFSGGVRVENNKMHTDREKYYNLRYPENDGRRGTFKPYLSDETVYLPSANLVFRLNRNIEAPVNLRLNYSKSVARPSLRETTNFTAYDFELFTYVEGNTSLKTVHIENYDFRVESFFKNGDNVSLSLFYKDFLNHIEFVDASRWQNTGKSYVKGIELEAKKSIFRNFTAMANVTLVKSLTTNIVQVYDTISRPMYGQAPYVINGMLSYNSDKLGLSAAITYNYQGEKLIISSSTVSPDIYELPRHLIDFKVSKNMFKHFAITFKCRDVLNTSLRKAYKYAVGWIDYENYTYGSSYIVALSYKL